MSESDAHYTLSLINARVIIVGERAITRPARVPIMCPILVCRRAAWPRSIAPTSRRCRFRRADIE